MARRRFKPEDIRRAAFGPAPISAPLNLEDRFAPGRPVGGPIAEGRPAPVRPDVGIPRMPVGRVPRLPGTTPGTPIGAPIRRGEERERFGPRRLRAIQLGNTTFLNRLRERLKKRRRAGA